MALLKGRLFAGALFAGALLGGATVENSGHRSLLAPWLGGASSPVIVVNGGVRSMMAFWAGGAFGSGAVAPVAQDNFGGRNYYRFAFESVEKKRKAADVALVAKTKLPIRDSVAESLDELRQLLLNKLPVKEITEEPKWRRIHGTIHAPKSGRLGGRLLLPAIVTDPVRDDEVGVLADGTAALQLPVAAPVPVVTSSAPASLESLESPAAMEAAALSEDIEEYNLMMMLTIIAAHA